MSILHEPNYDRGSNIFWSQLKVGEWIQFCWIKNVMEYAPDASIVSTGRVPSSQIVWEGWGLNDIHANNAKPILYAGEELITAPDAIMVVNEVQYCAEVKTKQLHPYYNNIIIDLKECSEIQEAANFMQMKPLFVFHVRDDGDPDPEEHMGDMDKIPPISSYYVADLDDIERLPQEITRGKRSYRIPFELVTPASEFLGVHDA